VLLVFELAEQLGDIGLADTAEDPRQDLVERPVAGQNVTANDHVERVFRCHVSITSSRDR